MNTKPLLATAIDGPTEQPNGTLLVEILDLPPFIASQTIQCRVIKVLESNGRTCRPGDVMRTTINKLFIHESPACQTKN